MQDNTTSSVLQVFASEQLSEHNNSIENIDYQFQNNEITINRSCDTIIPLFIKSNNPIEFLELYIGSSCILNFPLNFTNILQDFNRSDEFTYKIPWELFKIKELPIIAIQFMEVKFKNSVINGFPKTYFINCVFFFYNFIHFL